MPQTILMYKNYSEAEALEALPDIAPATVSSWFASDVATGKLRRERRFPHPASAPLIAGSDLIRLAHHTRGTARFCGEV